MKKLLLGFTLLIAHLLHAQRGRLEIGQDQSFILFPAMCVVLL